MVLQCHHHLLFPPLDPGVPGEIGGKTQKGKDKQKPEKSLHNVELPVKDVADPMDCCLARIFFCCLYQGILPFLGSHSGPSEVLELYLVLAILLSFKMIEKG